jgi:hypothetical protein
MRGRRLLPAEGFGIGPGKAGTVDGQVEEGESDAVFEVNRESGVLMRSIRLGAHSYAHAEKVRCS